MNSETRPIEWAILIATVAGAIIQPVLTYFLEKRRDKKFAELKSDFEKMLEEEQKRIKNLERERFKERMKHGKDFAKFIIKFSKDMEKAGKKIGEKACPNCRNMLEKFFKENFELS